MSTQPQGIIPEWTLGDRLRKAREETGLDQGQFADEIGISRNSVSNAETGATRPIKVTLKAWALRTGVPVEWLLTGVVPAGPKPTDYGYAQVVSLRAA